MRLETSKLYMIKAVFVGLLTGSRAAAHFGHHGLDPDRVISSITVLVLAVLVTLRPIAIIKRIAFFAILLPLIYSAIFAYQMYSAGEIISANSWLSIILLAAALIPLFLMPTRQKAIVVTP
jgi:hypothetical protein